MSRRLAVVSFFLEWPSRGGGILHTLELCRFLEQAGYEVRLFHPRFEPWGIGAVAAGCPFPEQAIPFSPAEWHITGIQQKFRRVVGEFDPDVVLVTDCWSFKPHFVEAFADRRVFIRLQAQECLCPLNNLRLLPDPKTVFRGCPFHHFATPHACQSCLARHGSSSGSLHRMDRWLSQVQTPEYQTTLLRAFQTAEAVLVLNPLHAEALRPWCRSVEVVTWGMDPERFPQPVERSATDPVRLQFAGVQGELIKGYHVLRQAGELLWQRRRDFEIVITEDAPESLSEMRPFECFIGWQSQASLAECYRETDITVVPTIAPDGLSRTSVEAMAAARPVVASRSGGLPYSVVDGFTGLLFEPGDAADLARQLESLLDSPNRRNQLGWAGRQVFLDRFTWPRVIQSRYLPLLGNP